MKIRIAVYGRHEPEFTVRLGWGIGDTWEVADSRLLKNLHALGVNLKNGEWEEWAMGGIELAEEEKP